MATTAYDVAALLITLQLDAGRTIDKMQLQKFLYLVQGANLEYWGEPAFREVFRAYRNGPVVGTVERTYRKASPNSNGLTRPIGGHPERLSDEVVDTVRSVLRYFGDWSGPELERYVKSRNSPWERARGGLPPSAPSDAEMPLDEIAAWFHQHGVDPAPEPVPLWEPTDAEREAARERLRRNKASDAAYAAEIEEIALRALARMSAEGHRDD